MASTLEVPALSVGRWSLQMVREGGEVSDYAIPCHMNVHCLMFDRSLGQSKHSLDCAMIFDHVQKAGPATSGQPRIAFAWADTLQGSSIHSSNPTLDP